MNKPSVDDTKTSTRSQQVPCQMCGTDHRGRPLTMTWNDSALCGGHELQQALAADDIATARIALEDQLVEQGYGRQIAAQIVSRVGPDFRAVSVNDVLPAQRDGRS